MKVLGCLGQHGREEEVHVRWSYGGGEVQFGWSSPLTVVEGGEEVEVEQDYFPRCDPYCSSRVTSPDTPPGTPTPGAPHPGAAGSSGEEDHPPTHSLIPPPSNYPSNQPFTQSSVHLSIHSIKHYKKW